MVAEAYARFTSIFHDPAATPRDKILAQVKICEMFGLQAPKVIQVETTSTKQKQYELVAAKMTTEHLVALAAAQRAAEEVSQETGQEVSLYKAS